MAPKRSTLLPSPATRDEHSKRTRDRIVAATRALMVESGFPRMSLEDVAQAAGVTRVTVYNQFGSRRGLLEAVFDDIAERGVFARLADTITRADPRDALRDTLREFCRIWASNEAVFRRVLGMAEVDPEVHDAFAPRDARRQRTSHDLVVRLAAARRLRPGWTRARAVAVLHTLTDFGTYQRLRSGGISGHLAIAEALIGLAGAVFDLGK